MKIPHLSVLFFPLYSSSFVISGRILSCVQKWIDRRNLAEILSVTFMPVDAIQSTKPLRRRSVYALAILFMLGLLALPPCVALQHTGAPQHPAVPPRQSTLPRTEKHESHHEIDQLEEAWRAAMLKGDSAVMGSLLADDFIAISVNGTLQTKEESLAKLSSGKKHLTSLELSDRRVRFYGSTALVTSKAEVSGTNAAEEDITGSYRYTRVYVRNAQGKWKIVSFEASRIREPGKRK